MRKVIFKVFNLMETGYDRNVVTNFLQDCYNKGYQITVHEMSGTHVSFVMEKN